MNTRTRGVEGLLSCTPSERSLTSSTPDFNAGARAKAGECANIDFEPYPQAELLKLPISQVQYQSLIIIRFAERVRPSSAFLRGNTMSESESRYADAR